MIKRMEEKERTEQNVQSEITYCPPDKPRWGEHLARNLALAGMLVITVAAVRTAELPTGKTVLTAVQQMIGGEWDDHVGSISFVGRFLPETVAVFFETDPDTALTAPCFGQIDHPWTEEEPYLGYQSEDKRVFAVAAGQVMSISHGPDEEYILRVRHEDGLETMYYNLASIAALEGDMVMSGTCLGEALPGGAIIEVRRAGRAIDPTGFITDRAGSAP